MPHEQPTNVAAGALDIASLRERFGALVVRWKRERGPHSSSAHLTDHPAYQDIIALGPAVVPLLLQELECCPDHWFRALQVLTGTNPVPEACRGHVREMAKAWLRWGRENGLVACREITA